MGNDFTDDGNQSEEEVKKPLETEEETEDSAETSDSENENEDEQEKDEASDDSETTEEESEEEEKKEEKSEEPTDEQQLQGLLDAEKKLDDDNTDIKDRIELARKRISDKRKDRREGRDLVESIDSAVPSESDTQDDLSDIDPDTMKVLDRYTKARGLVPKSELKNMSYKEKHEDAQSAFYSAHPEYLPENDTEDLLYKALKTELSLYAAPTDAKQIPKLFEKAHKAVSDLYPNKFKAAKKTVVVNKQDIQKKSELIKKQALGGGSGGGGGSGTRSSISGKSVKNFDSQQIQALRDGGWSDEDIKDLTK